MRPTNGTNGQAPAQDHLERPVLYLRPPSGLSTMPAPPVVIAHRGACGYRPEHTLAGYELAYRMGADFVEPDLVPTKDHILVARHENEVSGSTNVAAHPEFASRATTKVIDGKSRTGWFTEDFTLAELKTLRAIEPLPLTRPWNTPYDGDFEIPTLAELLELRERLSAQLGRRLGVCAEIKHATYFRSIGLDVETPLVRQARKAGLDSKAAPLIIQSFELTHLTDLRQDFAVEAPLVFLTGTQGGPYDLMAAGDPRTYADLVSADGLRSLAGVVEGIGPDKDQVIVRNPDGTLGESTAIVADAHAAGLKVRPYAFRAENTYLPTELRLGSGPSQCGLATQEQLLFLRTGIDGIITDQPDIAVNARAEFLTRRVSA